MKTIASSPFKRTGWFGILLLGIMLPLASAPTWAASTTVTLTSSDEHYFPTQTGTITFAVKMVVASSTSKLGLRLNTSASNLAEWEFVSCSGTKVPDVQPVAGDLGVWEFAFTQAQSGTIAFNIVLKYTGATLALADTSYDFIAVPLIGADQAKDTSGTVIYAKETLHVAAFHSADTNQDLRLSLSEILKVIQIYNTRNAGTRTGAYKYVTSVFEPDPSVASPVLPTSTHSADISSPTASGVSNGALESGELTKFLTLASYTTGGVRTGQYHVDPKATGFDRFVSGPK